MTDTITLPRAVVQGALEALESNKARWPEKTAAIAALREALEQPQQEPVAWMWVEDPRGANQYHFSVEKEEGWSDRWAPLYTAPPRREWVSLTEEELKPICDEYRILFGGWVNDFARAIEVRLKEKNA